MFFLLPENKEMSSRKFKQADFIDRLATPWPEVEI